MISAEDTVLVSEASVLAREHVDWLLRDERDEAVKRSIRSLIKRAHAEGTKVGLCGQAPSDYPEMAEYLVELGIDSMSLNPDTVLSTTQHILEVEARLVRPRVAVSVASYGSRRAFVYGAVVTAQAVAFAVIGSSPAPLFVRVARPCSMRPRSSSWRDTFRPCWKAS